MLVTFGKSAAFAVGLILVLIALGMVFEDLRPAVDFALSPGYVIPEAYWGGIHDPMQILAANILNLIVYTLAFVAVARLRDRWGRQPRPAR